MPVQISVPEPDQCSGAGSVGSVCFWATQIRKYFVRIRILPSTRKKLIKTFSAFSWLLNDFLSLKTDVNVPTYQKVMSKITYLSKSNEQNKLDKKTYFLLASWKSLTKRAGWVGSGLVNQVCGSKDPDQDRTKMSRIRNTGSDVYNEFFLEILLSCQPQWVLNTNSEFRSIQKIGN